MIEVEWENSDIFVREFFDSPSCAEFGCYDGRKEKRTIILPKSTPIGLRIFMVRVIRFVEADEETCIKKDFFLFILHTP